MEFDESAACSARAYEALTAGDQGGSQLGEFRYQSLGMLGGCASLSDEGWRVIGLEGSRVDQR